MLTPKELYYSYTINPCDDQYDDFFNRPGGTVGAGTPYDLPRLSNFLKQLKYPCYSRAPHARTSGPSGIMDTGKYKLCLPYKFLQRLDVEAFTEIQPDIKSGTSHAIRNACDIMRACSLEKNKKYTDWEHRGATEYMQYFGNNYITDCLMLLGPDLVEESVALYDRATGCDELDCLPAWKPGAQGSALGSPAFKCAPKEPKGEECSPCRKCDPEQKEDPCCKGLSCVEKMTICCTDVVGERNAQFRLGVGDRIRYGITQDEINLPIEEYPLIHIGLLKRKSYVGYVNLLNNSGSNFYSCPGDLLLKYFQKHNSYDYKNNIYKKTSDTAKAIDRVRTISLVYFDDPSKTVSSIKDLLCNGYGVLLMTNIGFPNYRDSTGLSYPDRIWYHSYAIIGYDDRKADYDECVYLLANSWGKWNDGGQPSWGPIPDGSFLVTESHLKCMVKLFRSDKKPCRKTTTIDNQEIGCEGVLNDTCSPWDCAKGQSSAGMVFAISMTEGFPKQSLDFSQFYKVRENSYEPNLTMYFTGNDE